MIASPHEKESAPDVAVPQRFSRKAGTLAVFLGLAVFALRLRLAGPLTFCGTPDACFYLGMAQTLGSGQGWHARFLYDFQQLHPTLPNTGLEYWRPGISLLLLALKPVGITLFTSTALTILVGVILASAAWHVAFRVTGDRWLALGSFALCLFSSPVWIGSASPDSGLYYGAAVAWFLALFTIRRQSLWADLGALVCVCAAYCIRNDAALLLVPLLAVLWARHQRPSHDGSTAPAAPSARRHGGSLPYAACMVAGFLVALAPMHLLYARVLGTAFPSGTAQVLFLNDLGDFNRYQAPATLQSLLQHGVKHLLLFRVGTLATVLYRIAALMIGYPALVFLPALLLPRSTGSTVRRADPPTHAESIGPVSFGLTALFVYTFVLAAIGGFSALRTAVGLMPFASVLVLVAIRRASRTPQIATWLSVAVIAANAVSGLMEVRRDLPAANQIGDADRAVAAELADLGATPSTGVVLTNDPVQFSVTTGYATVALPSNGLDAIAAAARDFHVTHVILDSENLPASPALLKQQLHPVRFRTLDREHAVILELPHPDTNP